MATNDKTKHIQSSHLETLKKCNYLPGLVKVAGKCTPGHCSNKIDIVLLNRMILRYDSPLILPILPSDIITTRSDNRCLK